MDGGDNLAGARAAGGLSRYANGVSLGPQEEVSSRANVGKCLETGGNFGH